MLTASLADVRAEYERILQTGHHQAFLGEHDGRPAFLMERYDPAFDAVGGTYTPAPGDIGMHVLVGPPEPGQRVPGFTGAVFETILEGTCSVTRWWVGWWSSRTSATPRSRP